MRALLLLALGPLLLSACSSKGITQLRAQVRGWSGGTGQIKVLAADQTVLTSSTLDSVGRFTLPLPDAQLLSAFLRASLLPDGQNASSHCTGSVTSSGPAARFYQISQLSAFPAGGAAPLTLVSQTRSNDPVGAQRLDQRGLVYASAATRVQGERRCPMASASGARTITASFALNLKAGWNDVVSRQSQDADGNSASRLESVGDDGFEGWAVK
ncbi:hypothetical protein [Deinococcus alpinitundrae]|uniref:hypothetical protein n=1 Tax=Deinococcus alpinitundrae TaxID=468913 RepID=UPI00137940DB|nr:hypothetical protein [Deinococcus alpinitundrae]